MVPRPGCGSAVLTGPCPASSLSGEIGELNKEIAACGTGQRYNLGLGGGFVCASWVGWGLGPWGGGRGRVSGEDGRGTRAGERLQNLFFFLGFGSLL